jgi:hypothetical protein
MPKENIIDMVQVNEVNIDNLLKSRNYVVKNNYWNDDHEKILESLQKNSNRLYKEYQKAHLEYRKKLRWYRIPIIILSGLGGFLSISNTGYIPLEYNKWVSLFVGFINLMLTIISLIENFKKIDVNVNKTYTAYSEIKKLHDDISLTLNTPRNERNTNGYDAAVDFFNRYQTYVSDAPILKKIFKDYLDNNSPDNNSETITCNDSDNTESVFINQIKNKIKNISNDDDSQEYIQKVENILVFAKDKKNETINEKKSDISNKISILSDYVAKSDVKLLSDIENAIECNDNDNSASNNGNNDYS